jgi:hypothetical protein
MKALVVALTLFFATSLAQAQSCKLDGVYKIKSKEWSSFSVWTLAFKNDKLVNSFTDDLPAKSWPTQMTRNRGDVDELIMLDVTLMDEGTDMVFRYSALLSKECDKKKAVLSLISANELHLDTGSAQDSAAAILKDATLTD